MIVVWRGRGLVALAAAILPLLPCAGLVDLNNPALYFIAPGGASILVGLVCWRLGKRWNQGSGYHSLYWIPLETWGWIYMVLGEFWTGLVVIGWIHKTFLK